MTDRLEGRFGDGVPFPGSAVKPYDSGIPSLDALYELALAARLKGLDYVHVLVSGDGRPWAMTVKAHGLLGTVVRRFRSPATEKEIRDGRSIDSGAVAWLTVQFQVLEIVVVYKREYLRRTNPDSRKLPVNRKRRRLIRNISIR